MSFSTSMWTVSFLSTVSVCHFCLFSEYPDFTFNSWHATPIPHKSSIVIGEDLTNVSLKLPLLLALLLPPPISSPSVGSVAASSFSRPMQGASFTIHTIRISLDFDIFVALWYDWRDSNYWL